MTRRAAILGYAAVPVGSHQRAQGDAAVLEHELATGVVLDAMAMAGLGREDLEGVVVAHPGDHTRQCYFHTFLTAHLGIRARSTVMQVLGNGMTGGHAFDQALQQVTSGQADCVLSVGVHFETGVPTARHLDYSIRLTGDVDFQTVFGAVPIAWYAMDAQRYLHEHRMPRATLASIAVKNRLHAQRNPLAQYRGPLSLDDVLNARPIVEPLGLYEVPGRADGAVALVIVSEDAARASGRPYVIVRGRGFEHEGLHQIADRPSDALDYGTLRIASRRALDDAGLALCDIGTFQVYAPCTIVEALGTEALGLFPRGRGAPAAAAGETRFDGRHPVNTCGGCLSRGHPPEVTPLYDVVESVMQVLGRAGDRQVARHAFAMTICELGKYNAALVHVLEGAA
ncbi:MAG TPA: thiolase family protein [Quisquiliibacterium sp.]|nr:thiolase family protein [Quisquiliibacterium sp.]HQD81678.1 thiolase family protein [Quisquiliibacterium sp.]